MASSHIDPMFIALPFESLADAALSRAKNRGARMTKRGVTTAQLRVAREYTRSLFAFLRQLGGGKTIHIGKATLQLRQNGRKAILETRGL